MGLHLSIGEGSMLQYSVNVETVLNFPEPQVYSQDSRGLPC